MKKILILFLFLFNIYIIHLSAEIRESKYLRAESFFSPMKVVSNSSITVGFKIELIQPFHINSNQPFEKYLIPANLEIISQNNLKSQ